MHTEIISKEGLLRHWQGHRDLTRRVIEAFPEKELFSFSIGGMRPFSEMVKELISIDEPGLRGIVHQQEEQLDHKLSIDSKQALLDAWDAFTPEIEKLFMAIPEEDFPKMFNLFGQFNYPIISNILYFIDNQIHHRGQGYVYLRALGIEPPFFWEREK